MHYDQCHVRTAVRESLNLKINVLLVQCVRWAQVFLNTMVLYPVKGRIQESVFLVHLACIKVQKVQPHTTINVRFAQEEKKQILGKTNVDGVMLRCKM